MLPEISGQHHGNDTAARLWRRRDGDFSPGVALNRRVYAAKRHAGGIGLIAAVDCVRVISGCERSGRRETRHTHQDFGCARSVGLGGCRSAQCAHQAQNDGAKRPENDVISLAVICHNFRPVDVRASARHRVFIRSAGGFCLTRRAGLTHAELEARHAKSAFAANQGVFRTRLVSQVTRQPKRNKNLRKCERSSRGNNFLTADG